MNGVLKEKKENLIKGTLIYALGSFGSKILSFIIVPLYTFYIVPEELGQYDLLLVTVSLLYPLVSLQFTDASYKWSVDDKENQPKYFFLTYWILGISSIITTCIILILGRYFLGLKASIYLILMLLSQVWFTSLQRLLRVNYNQKKFVISGLIQSFSFLILIVALVCFLKKGLDGLCISYTLSQVIPIVYVLTDKALRKIKSCFDKELMRKMILFAIPLVPSAMCWWMINSSDKYFIAWFVGAAGNGIYAVSSKFPTIIQTINSVFYSSWQDVAIREKKGEERDKLFSDTFETYYKLSFGIILVIIPMLHLLLPFFISDAYASASEYMAFLFLGAVFQGFASYFGIIYLSENITFGATTTSFIAVVTNIIVDFALMKTLGLYAAGISTFIGFFVIFIIRLKDTAKYVNMKINKFQFMILFLISLMTTIINSFNNVFLEIGTFVVGGCIFVVVNYQTIIVCYKKIAVKIFKK